jgi:hypothetical protein
VAKRMHYRDSYARKGHGQRVALTVCGQGGGVPTTRDKDKVTCKRCRKSMFLDDCRDDYKQEMDS